MSKKESSHSWKEGKRCSKVNSWIGPSFKISSVANRRINDYPTEAKAAGWGHPSGSVRSRDAALKPPWMGSRRLPEGWPQLAAGAITRRLGPAIKPINQSDLRQPPTQKKHQPPAPQPPPPPSQRSQHIGPSTPPYDPDPS